MPLVELNTDWCNTNKGSLAPCVGVIDQISFQDGPYTACGPDKVQHRVSAYSRTLVLVDETASSLPKQVPLSIRIQREFFSGKGKFTDIQFQQESHFARYVATISGALLEDLSSYIPNIESLRIACNASSKVKKREGANHREVLQTLSLIAITSDNERIPIHIIDSGNPSQVFRNMADKIRQYIFQNASSKALDDNSRWGSNMEDLEHFSYMLTLIGEELDKRKRAEKNAERMRRMKADNELTSIPDLQPDWVPLDLIEVEAENNTIKELGLFIPVKEE